MRDLNSRQERSQILSSSKYSCPTACLFRLSDKILLFAFYRACSLDVQDVTVSSFDDTINDFNRFRLSCVIVRFLQVFSLLSDSKLRVIKVEFLFYYLICRAFQSENS